MKHYGSSHSDSAAPTAHIPPASAAQIESQSGQLLRSLFPGSKLAPCEVSEWVYLNEGERIVAQRPWENPKSGLVDAVSDDAYFFWIWLDNGEGRIVVSAHEGASVWRFS